VKSDDLRLLLSTRGSRRLVLIALFAAVIWSVILIANAFLIAVVIVRIIGHYAVSKYIIALGLLWLVRALFQAGFEYWSTSQAIDIKRDLRNEVTSQVGAYASVSPGELSNVLTKGLNALDIYLGRFIPQVLFAIVTPLAVVVAIFFFDPLSSLIAILTLPLIPFFGVLIGRYSSDAVARKWQSLGTLARYFEDSLRGFTTLKIFGRNESQSQRIGQMGEKYTDETMKVLRISFLSAFSLELVATISVAVVAVSVGLRLVSGSMDFQRALIVLVLIPEVYFPVRNAASLFHASEDGTQALRELAQVGAGRIQQYVESHDRIEPESIRALSWQKWNFHRNEAETILIRPARVNRGEMVFIVGESGIGKTTFAANLLAITFNAQVEWHTDSGTLILDRSWQKQWQKLLGWIPQNPQLASGTVRDQFLLLSPTLSDSEIEDALLRAGLSTEDLPMGLGTKMGKSGEQGHAASGGQIRKIAVARALIRKPTIVIADEPTADLDHQSATQVMSMLRAAKGEGAIVICITHDQSLLEPGDLMITVEREKS
jgi:ABC-type transport system involved in cytochrome bd biosynthesis fused ATPase/permease subunit